MRRFFAVRDKAEDRLAAFVSAESPEDLVGRFPEIDFEIVDMTDKGSPPIWPNAGFEDLTVEFGEWKWKVTEAEADLREWEKRSLSLRSQLVTLTLQKEKADALGPEYADVAAAFQSRIDEIQAELAGL